MNWLNLSACQTRRFLLLLLGAIVIVPPMSSAPCSPRSSRSRSRRTITHVLYPVQQPLFYPYPMPYPPNGNDVVTRTLTRLPDDSPLRPGQVINLPTGNNNGRNNNGNNNNNNGNGGQPGGNRNNGGTTGNGNSFMVKPKTTHHYMLGPHGIWYPVPVTTLHLVPAEGLKPVSTIGDNIPTLALARKFGTTNLNGDNYDRTFGRDSGRDHDRSSPNGGFSPTDRTGGDSNRDNSRRDNPNMDNSNRDNPSRDNFSRDNPTRDNFSRDNPTRDNPSKDTLNRDNTDQDNTNRDTRRSQ